MTASRRKRRDGPFVATENRVASGDAAAGQPRTIFEAAQLAIDALDRLRAGKSSPRDAMVVVAQVRRANATARRMLRGPGQ